MAFDFKSLQKLATPAPSTAFKGAAGDDRVLVLVKLREGAAKPAYITERSQISSQIFSAEITAKDLPRLEAEPDVESVALSEQLPLIK